MNYTSVYNMLVNLILFINKTNFEYISISLLNSSTSYQNDFTNRYSLMIGVCVFSLTGSKIYSAMKKTWWGGGEEFGKS